MNTKNMQGFSQLKLVLSLALVALLVGFAVWRATHMAASMSVIAGSAKDLQQAAPDSKTKIVVEVSDVDAQRMIHATLLEKKTEEIYARTKTAVDIQASDETKMVMGKFEEVQKSAVIHVTGTTRADRTVVAEQIAILSKYVKVTD